MTSANLIGLLIAREEEEEEDARAPKPYLLMSDVVEFYGSGGMCLQSYPCQHTAYFDIELPRDPEEEAKQEEKREKAKLAQKAGGPPSFPDFARRPRTKQISAGLNGRTACIISRMMGTKPEEHFKKYDDKLGKDFALPAEIELTNFVLRYDRDHPLCVERAVSLGAEARLLAKEQLANVKRQRVALEEEEKRLEAKLA